jgi:copper chaperone CopZ
MLPSTPRTFIGPTTFTVVQATGAEHPNGLIAAIRAVQGVEAVTVDPASGTATVTASRPVDRADVAAAVHGAGFALLP